MKTENVRWLFEENEKLGISPDGLKIGAGIKAWWICKTCGHKWMTTIASVAWRGSGCSKCSHNFKLTIDNFVRKANIMHNNTYDYSKFQCNGFHTRGIIIYPKHGDFQQDPAHHLNGQKYPKCYGRDKTTKDVVSHFKSVHGDRYIYSKFEYKDRHYKGIIICRIHGEFLQSTTVHSKGVGCPHCANENKGKANKKTIDQRIIGFKAIHGDRYDYSKFEDNGRHVKGIIICKIHGEFLKTPNKHLRGEGCQKCSKRGPKQKTNK